MITNAEGLNISARVPDEYLRILTPEAREFLSKLARNFETRRQGLLETRIARQREIDHGKLPDFLPETKHIRDAEWTVGPIPQDLTDRRVEITGPADRKMVINALNSGANVFMADLEDANSPSWENNIEGQINLQDAVNGTIAFESPEGKKYKLGEKVSTLLVRPRGWHLVEKHVTVDGSPISASLFDFGLYFFHNAKNLLAKGSGPYFYLPKLESHLEARLWNDVFNFAQDELGVPRGSIRATVLIETIFGAFEMDEILYELRDHSAGLNAGRWDYMFSIIKSFRSRGRDFLLPDRNSVTMTVPFMRAYTELLVRTCHKRGAHAMGGMAAFIPSKDEKVNEAAYAKVKDDKSREAADGFDGSWVAHPGMVETCRAAYDAVLGDRPNQRDRLREEVTVSAEELLDVRSTPGDVTEAGLRGNVSVALQYIETWLRGQGAVDINNMVEDAATAEISRCQVWQWLHNDIKLADSGETVTRELVGRVIDEEVAAIRERLGDEAFASGRWDDARALFTDLALADELADFLTIPAYERMP
jgi:malate synthase